MYSSIMGPQNTQLHNLNLVLKRIKGDGPISRADIARTLNCSKSTMTGIITQLISYDLVREIGKGNPATGRKSTLLEFNPRAKFVIAIDSRPDHVHLAVMDLSGVVEATLILPDKGTEPAAFVRNLIAGIGELIEASRIGQTQFVAIGIMISGIVDTSRGIVLYSALMNWEDDFDLATPVREAFNIPVFLENDVNALALAEFWLGCGQSASSIAYLYLDKKIGGAYVDDGFIIRGADYAFAEFGKLIIAGDSGPEQLESRLSRYFASLPKPGDQMPDFILQSLSQAISSIVAILNPGTIILGGFEHIDANTIERLRVRSKSLLPPRPNRTISIVKATLHGRNEILGAAAIAINNTSFKFIIQG